MKVLLFIMLKIVEVAAVVAGVVFIPEKIADVIAVLFTFVFLSIILIVSFIASVKVNWWLAQDITDKFKRKKHITS